MTDLGLVLLGMGICTGLQVMLILPILFLARRAWLQD